VVPGALIFDPQGSCHGCTCRLGVGSEAGPPQV
jgi:hypothetical protein